MLTLPSDIVALLTAFAPLFSPSVLEHAQVLLTGAILTPGQRTVTTVLRAMGLSHQRQFQNYHRVLNRATWSPRQGAAILLRVLLRHLLPQGPVVVGCDDTIERRRGAKIAAKGIYRDPVRSSHSHLVKTSGLRWLSLMLLAPVPFARRVWALPFLTVLVPSERAQKEHAAQRHHHKTLLDFTRQAIQQVSRWLPDRSLVVVADSSFAAIEFLFALQKASQRPVTVVTRLRLEAALYEPAPPPPPGKKSHNGRPRVKGLRLPTLENRLQNATTLWQRVTVPQWYGHTGRSKNRKALSKVPGRPHQSQISNQPRELEIATDTAIWYHCGKPPLALRWVLIRDPQEEFEPQALLSTDPTLDPVSIITWYAQRWQVEVTFRQVREHLGVETQRQWNEPAIARTTPCLLALFSIITLLAQQLHVQQVGAGGGCRVRQSAWYVKEQATFSDALAWVRRHIWSHAQRPFSTSEFKPDREKLQQAVLERMTDLLCYAA